MGAHHGYRPYGNDRNVFLNYLYDNFKPELVCDFNEDIYILDYRIRNFDDILTYSSASLRTMYDSTGKLVWAPHNLLDYSQTFDTGWTASNMTVSANSVVAPDGTTTAATLTGTENTLTRVFNEGTAGQSGSNVTTGLFVKAGTAPYMTLRLYDGAAAYTVSFDTSDWSTAASSGASNIVSTALADGWQYISFDVANPGNRTVGEISVQDTAGYSTDGSAGTLYVWGAHVFRSDLGGMADNPDQPAGLEKYVPTTSAAVYLSRRNAYYHNGSAWTKGGLQLESAAATNLLPYGVDFTNGAWGRVDVSVALSSGDIYEITESGTGTQTPYLIDAVTITSGAAHCISIDVKDVDRGYAFLQWTDAVSRFSINVDLSDGSVTDTYTVNTPGVVGYGAIDLGGGWYRLWISATSASTTGYLVVGPSDSATPSWTGASTASYTVSGKKIQVRYAQLEAGSVPTSYIPTSGSTVTRAAETLSIAGADTPANTTAMSISMKGLITYADLNEPGAAYFYRWPGSDYELYLNTDSSRTGQVYSIIRTPSAMYSQTTSTAFSPGTNLPYSFATAFATNTSRFASDGVLQSDILETGTIPDRSSQTLNIGTKYNGFISELRMWGTDIGDSGIESVTS